MKLYYTPTACSLSTHIILHETGIHFELERVDLATKTTEHGDNYLLTNPKGQVPALLLDSGDLLTEGVAIALYLAHHVPAKHFMPEQDSLDYYMALSWLNYIATELHQKFITLYLPNISDEVRQSIKHKLEEKLAYVDAQLKNKDYVMGNQFTIVDPYLYTVLTWARKNDLNIKTLNNLNGFIERLESRPSVKAALATEAK